MLFASALGKLTDRFPHRIQTIDSHTAGEPTRLIVSGLPPVPGKTMKEKLDYFKTHYDTIRMQLTREPRGHRDAFAAMVTEPTSPDAHFGLIYMDARRYPFLCGHATMGAVTTLIESGRIKPSGPETRVCVDTPSGMMETRAFIGSETVSAVAIRTVPSFVYQTDQSLHIAGMPSLTVETVCVGGFFVMVSADQLKVSLDTENSHSLIDLGMKIIDAANEQLTVKHPLRSEVKTVDVVEFYDPSAHGRGIGKNVVVLGEGHMDRSPCGTGTAAKLTLLNHLGRWDLEQPFTNYGPMGTHFDAHIVSKEKVGAFDSVVVEIKGSAHFTGFNEFVVDPGDPLAEGYLI